MTLIPQNNNKNRLERKEIYVKRGITQGDFLSPFLFNLIMDSIINNLLKTMRYKMENIYLKVLCYAHDAVFVPDFEENLEIPGNTN